MKALDHPTQLIASKICLAMAVLLATLLLIASPLSAHAAPKRVATPEIERIESFIAEAEFEQALELVRIELMQIDLSEEVTGRLYELQGMVYLYLGNEDAAARSFRTLLKRSPDYEQQANVSPKMRKLFEDAREEVAQEIAGQLKLRHPRPAPAEPGAPINVEIVMEGALQGVRPKLFYRRDPGRKFSDTRFVQSEENANRWVATVPGIDFDTAAPTTEVKNALEYYIQVLGPGDSLLAIAGKEDAPLSVAFLGNEGLTDSGVAASADGAVSPWYKKWWVWTIVGVVVVGAATGGIIYALSDQTGTVPITVTVE